MNFCDVRIVRADAANSTVCSVAVQRLQAHDLESPPEVIQAGDLRKDSLAARIQRLCANACPFPVSPGRDSSPLIDVPTLAERFGVNQRQVRRLVAERGPG